VARDLPGQYRPDLRRRHRRAEPATTTGFTADEIARYQEIGLTTPEIEELRQAYANDNPADKVITMRQELADFAATHRALGNLLINPPPTFSQQVGGGDGASRRCELGRRYDVERTLEVATVHDRDIDLKVRAHMPADWGVVVSPDRLTSTRAGGGHGPHQSGQRRARGRRRVAVEATSGDLVRGVEIKVVIPLRRSADGSSCRWSRARPYRRLNAKGRPDRVVGAARTSNRSIQLLECRRARVAALH
jgi:hypothetical protein